MAQRLNRAADRLSDRPMPAELDKIRQLSIAIDVDYMQETLEAEQAEETGGGADTSASAT
jgi:hypothetical protein